MCQDVFLKLNKNITEIAIKIMNPSIRIHHASPAKTKDMYENFSLLLTIK